LETICVRFSYLPIDSLGEKCFYRYMTQESNNEIKTVTELTLLEKLKSWLNLITGFIKVGGDFG
jgi:hypothetical protein